MKRYYANITHCLLDNRRLLEIADFVGQLNGEVNPATPEADESEQITEALALTDARVGPAKRNTQYAIRATNK